MRFCWAILMFGACGASYPPCPSGVEIEPGRGTPSCETVDSEIAQAKELLVLTGAWPEADPAGVGFVVFARPDWRAFGGAEIAGQTVAPSTVYLGSSLRGAAHELMHVHANWQGGAGAPNNYAHAGWDVDGRWAISNLFSYAMTNDNYIDGGDECSIPALPAEWRSRLLAAEWHTRDWGRTVHDWDTTMQAIHTAFCVR